MDFEQLRRRELLSYGASAFLGELEFLDGLLTLAKVVEDHQRDQAAHRAHPQRVPEPDGRRRRHARAHAHRRVWKRKCGDCGTGQRCSRHCENCKRRALRARAEAFDRLQGRDDCDNDDEIAHRLVQLLDNPVLHASKYYEFGPHRLEEEVCELQRNQDGSLRAPIRCRNWRRRRLGWSVRFRNVRRSARVHPSSAAAAPGILSSCGSRQGSDSRAITPPVSRSSSASAACSPKRAASCRRMFARPTP